MVPYSTNGPPLGSPKDETRFELRSDVTQRPSTSPRPTDIPMAVSEAPEPAKITMARAEHPGGSGEGQGEHHAKGPAKKVLHTKNLLLVTPLNSFQ